jgi:hypothetical protein
MVTTPSLSGKEAAGRPGWRWWLSLYPRLTTRGKRGMVVACLGAALLVQSFGGLGLPRQSPGSQPADGNAAVQNALHELGLSAPAGPNGDQFQVNSYTTSNQNRAAVAMDSDGDFVVVWASAGSSGSDTSYSSIQGQRYNAAGTAQGSEFQVNSYTNNDQQLPAVGMDSDGDFVIVWESNGSPGPGPAGETDTSGISIQGQRYNAAGTAQGSQFQINSYTTGDQHEPAVGMDSDGDFVVVWESDGSPGSGPAGETDTSGFSVQGQRYNVAGTAQGGQFQVNSYTTDTQGAPAVSLDSDGDLVVVWISYGASGDTSGFSIQGQRYNSSGTAQGGQFQANSYTTSQQRKSAVALDSNGDFVIVWSSIGSNYGDTSGESIQGQRYNAAGTAQGSQFQVNSYTTDWQSFPAVALDNDGDFVVVWQSYGSGNGDTSGYGILGQRYNSAGTAQGSEFQVNSYTTDHQALPAVARDSDGEFAAVWQSYGSVDDTSGFSIQGRLFAASGPEPTPTPTFTPTSSPGPTSTATATSLPGPTNTPTATPASPGDEWFIYLPVVSDSSP